MPLERRRCVRLKAECIFARVLLVSLWDVKVYVVSVDTLGTVHVFISGLCDCEHFCALSRSVCL